ncbi:50S ribosomal protein L29 [Emticicia fontis]
MNYLNETFIFLLIHSFKNKMKKSEIQALSVEQLQQNISVEKDRINKLKFAHAITPIENPMRIRQSRRLIAQMLTELNAR